MRPRKTPGIILGSQQNGQRNKLHFQNTFIVARPPEKLKTNNNKKKPRTHTRTPEIKNYLHTVAFERAEKRFALSPSRSGKPARFDSFWGTCVKVLKMCNFFLFRGFYTQELDLTAPVEELLWCRSVTLDVKGLLNMF